MTCQTKLVTDDSEYTIARQVRPGEVWMQSGLVFKKHGQLSGHARALWGVGYEGRSK